MLTANHLSIARLAALQQNQGATNSCAIFSACEALNLLYGSLISAAYWRGQFDQMTFPEILKFRLYRNGPTLPIQQANQIRLIASRSGLPLPNIRVKSSNPSELIQILGSPNHAALVTIGWLFQTGPKIMHGQTSNNLNSTTSKFSYHTMLLGAHDPDHISADGILRPWGFVNSWTEPGAELFWISQQEFFESWSVITPTAGKNSLLTIIV